MTYRFQATGQTVAAAGSSFAHGLVGFVPNEWGIVPCIAQQGGSGLYRYAVPDGTNVYFANTTGSSSADIFASFTHSIIR